MFYINKTLYDGITAKYGSQIYKTKIIRDII